MRSDQEEAWRRFYLDGTLIGPQVAEQETIFPRGGRENVYPPCPKRSGKPQTVLIRDVRGESDPLRDKGQR